MVLDAQCWPKVSWAEPCFGPVACHAPRPKDPQDACGPNQAIRFGSLEVPSVPHESIGSLVRTAEPPQEGRFNLCSLVQVLIEGVAPVEGALGRRMVGRTFGWLGAYRPKEGRAVAGWPKVSWAEPCLGQVIYPAPGPKGLQDVLGPKVPRGSFGSS